MKIRPHVNYEYCYCLIYILPFLLYIYIYISVFTKIANEQMIYNFVKKNLFTSKTSQNEALAITFDRKSVHFVVYRPDLGSLPIPQNL